MKSTLDYLKPAAPVILHETEWKNYTASDIDDLDRRRDALKALFERAIPVFRVTSTHLGGTMFGLDTHIEIYDAKDQTLSVEQAQNVANALNIVATAHGASSAIASVRIWSESPGWVGYTKDGSAPAYGGVSTVIHAELVDNALLYALSQPEAIEHIRSPLGITAHQEVKPEPAPAIHNMNHLLAAGYQHQSSKPTH